MEKNGERTETSCGVLDEASHDHRELGDIDLIRFRLRCFLLLTEIRRLLWSGEVFVCFLLQSLLGEVLEKLLGGLSALCRERKQVSQGRRKGNVNRLL